MSDRGVLMQFKNQNGSNVEICFFKIISSFSIQEKPVLKPKWIECGNLLFQNYFFFFNSRKASSSLRTDYFVLFETELYLDVDVVTDAVDAAVIVVDIVFDAIATSIDVINMVVAYVADVVAVVWW